MTTAIVVDSAAALPRELVKRYGIVVVPMNLVIDGKSRPDNEVAPGELLRRLTDTEVTTSAPSPGEWATAIDKALTRADEAVVLTVSSEMSTTCRSAQLGAKLAGGRAHVVDTRSAAGGEGLIAVTAARYAERGLAATDIVNELKNVIDRVHLVATIENLDQLVRSGRIPDVAGAAAHALRVNPMFEFRHGNARALHPAMGRHAAEHRIVHSCLASRPQDGTRSFLHAAVLETACPERARSLQLAVRQEVPDVELFVASFGSVMLAHVGPGVLGLAWWWET